MRVEADVNRQRDSGIAFVHNRIHGDIKRRGLVERRSRRAELPESIRKETGGGVGVAAVTVAKRMLCREC